MFPEWNGPLCLALAAVFPIYHLRLFWWMYADKFISPVGEEVLIRVPMQTLEIPWDCGFPMMLINPPPMAVISIFWSWIKVPIFQSMELILEEVFLLNMWMAARADLTERA